MMVVTRFAANAAVTPRSTSISPYPETRSSTSSIDGQQGVGTVAIGSMDRAPEFVEIWGNDRHLDAERVLRRARVFHAGGGRNAHDRTRARQLSGSAELQRRGDRGRRRRLDKQTLTPCQERI